MSTLTWMAPSRLEPGVEREETPDGDESRPDREEAVAPLLLPPLPPLPWLSSKLARRALREWVVCV